jgi:hypothetical protein
MHQPIPEQGSWLASVLRGHYQYYAVPDNSDALSVFHRQITRNWLWTLRRRSQRTAVTWERMARLADRWLPNPKSCIRGPSSDSPPEPKAGAQCGNPARWDLCGGQPEAVWTHVPTRPKGCPYRDRYRQRDRGRMAAALMLATSRLLASTGRPDGPEFGRGALAGVERAFRALRGTWCHA